MFLNLVAVQGARRSRVGAFDLLAGYDTEQRNHGLIEDGVIIDGQDDGAAGVGRQDVQR